MIDMMVLWVYTCVKLINTLLKKDFIYLFLESGEGKEKEREASKYGCFSCSPNLACNPRMFPDWESNLRPFSSQAGVQSTEPHQLGL